MTTDEMAALSAGDAVAAMRDGRMTALAYAEALLARCAAGADLNAFIALDPNAVRTAARAADARRAAGQALGPLHGLPIPVKDSINTADLPTTAGTSALRDFRPTADAGVVARLRAAGAIVLGKTNLHELSFGWTSSNMAFGPVRNPWDRTPIPGGSSGGTAAAVAAGMAPLGLAEDTQGSIRVPAALCGIAGFRPTTGRYPNDGCAPITPLFDQVGPHARCVADLTLFDAVMTGDDTPLSVPPLAGLRIGIARNFYFSGIDPHVAAVVDDVVARLAAEGVTIVEADVPGLDSMIEAITLPIQIHDVVPSLTSWLVASGAPVSFDEMFAAVSPDVRAVFERYAVAGAPGAISEEVYFKARDVHLPALRTMMTRWFADQQVDAILLPATMITATPIGDDQRVRIGRQRCSVRHHRRSQHRAGKYRGSAGTGLAGGFRERPAGGDRTGRSGGKRSSAACDRSSDRSTSCSAHPREHKRTGARPGPLRHRRVEDAHSNARYLSAGMLGRKK